jgi:hypothetical protein
MVDHEHAVISSDVEVKAADQVQRQASAALSTRTTSQQPG